MVERKEMSDFHLDALQEVSNIGMGNAATALAGLLSKKVDMAIPKASFIDFEQVFPLVGGVEELVSCVNLSVEGEISGTVLFVFSEKSTYRLVEMLMGLEAGNIKELDAMGESAVKEIGNVLTGSFLNAIGDMTGLTMSSTVPMFAFDMFGAIFSTALVASGHLASKVLVIETLFSQEQDDITGRFFLLPETGALRRLFDVLGIPLANYK